MKKGIAVLALLAIALRLTALTGDKDAAGAWLRELSSVSVSVELGGKEEQGEDASPETMAPLAQTVEGTDPPETGAPSASPTAKPDPSPSPSPEADEAAEEEVLPGEETLPDILPTTIAGGLTIRNDTSYTPDLAQLLSQGMELTLPAEGVQILIVHTHGSEAYTPDGQDQYEASDSFRTQDTNYSVIRVGDELAEALESYGLTVTHDREIYDYPSYTGSYNRSGAAVEAHLAEHPETAIVIDLHRDALGTEDVIYKTVAALDGETSSQLMLVVGTGENGLEHPYWEENLKLALTMQAAVNARYPTLARPILLAQERYNQHLTTGSLILEVGSNGNTLQEALTAVRLFADAVGPVLADMVETPEPAAGS